ncbi:MAG: hypothetical protein C5B60_02640 [Chloroflexi bacterium]|nr:MAG: hypothetical protein C5B60_02640 [Chloroflexota bacterium]
MSEERGRGAGGRFERRPEAELPVNTPNITTPGTLAADPGRGRTAGAKVTVACKLPGGLLMRIFAPMTRPEPVMGGGTREVTTWEPTGQGRWARGNAVPYGVVPSWPIVGGYGLTHDVPKDFWDKYLEQNRDSPWIVHHLVFAYEDAAQAAAAAKEKAALKSGLEPLDPDNLPRGLGARGVSQIATASKDV